MDPNRPRIAPTLTPAGSAPDQPGTAPLAPARPPLQPELPGLTPRRNAAQWLSRLAGKMAAVLAALYRAGLRLWRALLPWLRRLRPWLRPARLAVYARTTVRLAGRALVWLIVTLLLLSLLAPGTVLWLRFQPPPTTAFMLDSTVQPVDYRWIPRSQIPESLRQAVVAAEDQKFWTHWGFDFAAIAEALEHNKTGKRTRGASTISQQTAKNLFLWPSRSWLRKGLEVGCTLLLEGLWDKERILEVYLNVAEFGPGIYGAEAAAQRFFHKPAARLTMDESVLLAAVLPNPRRWHADRPGPYVRARAERILALIMAPPEPEVEEEDGDWMDEAWLPEDGLPAPVPAEDGAGPATMPTDDPPEETRGEPSGTGETGTDGPGEEPVEEPTEEPSWRPDEPGQPESSPPAEVPDEAGAAAEGP